ncbi:MAG: hypothetical protein R6X32_06010 [Chloroflexota bacterium]
MSDRNLQVEVVMNDMPKMTMDVTIRVQHGWRLRLRLWLGTWLLGLAARVLNSEIEIVIEE